MPPTEEAIEQWLDEFDKIEGSIQASFPNGTPGHMVDVTWSVENADSIDLKLSQTALPVVKIGKSGTISRRLFRDQTVFSIIASRFGVSGTVASILVTSPCPEQIIELAYVEVKVGESVDELIQGPVLGNPLPDWVESIGIEVRGISRRAPDLVTCDEDGVHISIRLSVDVDNYPDVKVDFDCSVRVYADGNGNPIARTSALSSKIDLKFWDDPSIPTVELCAVKDKLEAVFVDGLNELRNFLPGRYFGHIRTAAQGIYYALCDGNASPGNSYAIKQSRRLSPSVD